VRIPAYFVVFVWFLVPFGLKANVELQPHRAYYTVTLAGLPPPHSTVVDVRGTMMVEYNHVCGGWTVQQISEVRRYYEDDSVDHIRWGYVTFEADDGSLFKFNTFRKINDELVEDIRGIAQNKDNRIEVTYQKPQPKTVKLQEGTLFPLQHIKALLEAAQNGDHMFSRLIFDGSSSDGASEINTFIGAKKVVAGNPAVEGGHQFANMPFWPVRFAIYGMGKTDYEPDYITLQDLLPSGIIKKYTIDDGTVKIDGILERVELLDKGGC